MTETNNKVGLNYEKSGVNVATGNRFVENIKSMTRSTNRPGVLGNIGGFGGLFELPKGKYSNPVLVSSTDGVGTKLKLALELDNHSTIGIDLVAMCVNDVIACGAEPLFFLDYFSTGHLELETAKEIVSGIANGCKDAGVALIGGETAEMPGLYSGKDYDLAGFCVGVVEKDKIIDVNKISFGDILIGLQSSGPHSNGYSLIRKVLAYTQTDLQSSFDGKTIGEILLTPTRIYVNSILKLLSHRTILGISHITGGGIIENLPRMLPKHLKANVDASSWKWPAIFRWLQEQGRVEEQEMLKTFNCGVGMILCVPKNEVDATLRTLSEMGENAWQLGVVQNRTDRKIDIC